MDWKTLFKDIKFIIFFILAVYVPCVIYYLLKFLYNLLKYLYLYIFSST